MDDLEGIPIEVCPKCKKRLHINGKWCPCEDKNTDVTDEESLSHWVESIKAQERKQNAAEIDHLKATIENLEMSAKSFADSSVDLVARKREQYGDLPSEVLITLRHARTFITSRQKMHKAGVELHDDLINRIKKDSKRKP